MGDETRFHQILHWFQNHKAFAWLLVAAVILSGAASVVGSIDTMARFYQAYFGGPQVPRVVIDPGRITEIPPPVSYGYVYDVQGDDVERLPGESDYLDHPAVSALRLYENDVPLKQAHSSHEEILRAGMGLYSHWSDDARHEYILFSSSDNSDPRVNARAYTLVAPDGASLTLEASKIMPVALRNFGYRFRGRDLAMSPANADCDVVSRVSTLRVLETTNGETRTLGPPHTSRALIEAQGEGRFNHCKDGTAVWLFFSTSDNSDPRSNGREYALTLATD